MVAPRFVNWNDYRDELARRVGDAVGRPVAFDGDLGLRLLPAPAFTADDIRIKAPPGFAQTDLATIKRLRVRVALAPLLSGRIQVESILVSAPRATVETDADGRVNWRAAAAAARSGAADGAARMGPLAQLLSFDQIAIENGRLDIIDARSGVRESIDDIELRVVAGSLTGPFQAGGAVAWRGAPLRLEATTGRFADAAAAPLRLSVMLPGGDPERLSGARFAGIVSPNGPEPLVQGELRIEGPNLHAAVQPLARAAGAAALTAAPALPFNFRASVEAGGDRLRFDNLETGLGDARAAGSAALALGEINDLTATLLIGRLDLDAWLKQRAAADEKNPRRAAAIIPNAVIPNAAVISNAIAPNATGSTPVDAPAVPMVSALTAQWPASLRAKLDLTIDAAILGGESLRQTRLIAQSDKNGVRVDRLSALGPGASSLAAVGGVGFSAVGAAADFHVEVKADNLRGLLGWLKTDVGAIPADRLSTATFAGRIVGDADRLEIADVEAAVDGAKFKGALNVNLGGVAAGERPALGLRLEAERVNFDDYYAKPAALPPPTPPAPRQTDDKNGVNRGAVWDNWEEAVARLLGRGDAAADLRVGEALIGGRLWRDLHVDAVAAGGGLDVRDAVGETDGVKVQLAGRAESFAPLTGVHATFSAAAADAAAAAARLAAAGLLSAETAAAAPAAPAALRARLAGNRDKLAVETTAEAAGATLEIGGETIKPLAFFGANGGGRYELSARLRHADADALFRLLGWSAAPAAPGPFDVFAKFNGDDRRVAVSDLKGVVGAAPVAGSGRYDGKAARPRIEADVQIGALDFSRVSYGPPALSAALSPPGANAPTGQTASAAADGKAAEDLRGAPLLRRFDGRFGLTADGLRFDVGDFSNVAAKAHLTDGLFSIDRFEAGYSGGRIGGRAELAAADPRTGRPARFAAAATAEGLKPNGSVALGPLALSGGVADAEADVAILDPAAPEPLRRLNGTARVSARNGVLKGIDLARLRDRLRQADRPQTVVDGVLRGLQGGETPLTTLDASCRIDAGVAETTDARLETSAGGVGAVGRVDLGARSLDILTTIEPDVDPPVPPLALRFSGPVEAPNRSLDLSALQRYLQERLNGGR